MEFYWKKLSEQGLISEQGGIYDEIDNRAGQVSPLYQHKELQGVLAHHGFLGE